MNDEIFEKAQQLRTLIAEYDTALESFDHVDPETGIKTWKNSQVCVYNVERDKHYYFYEGENASFAIGVERELLEIREALRKEYKDL